MKEKSPTMNAITLRAMKNYSNQIICESISRFGLVDRQRELTGFTENCLEFGYSCHRHNPREPADKLRKMHGKLIDQLLRIAKLINNLEDYMKIIVGEGKNYAMVAK